MLKGQKGITLIALVITIIVLIILAGVSISLVLGNQGILPRARQGKQNYQNAAVEERSALNSLTSEMDTEINKK